MKKVFSLGIVLLASITLASCGDSSKNTEKTGAATAKTETSASAESTSVSSSSNERNELEEGVAARNKFDANWSETWHDMTFSITQVSAVEFTDAEATNYMDTKYAVGVNFVIENNSDHKISTYPDQGKVVINGKQYEADMFVSDDVGADVMNGSKIEGAVVYPLSDNDFTSIDDIKEIRVVWTAYDSETEDYNDMNKDFDVTLELK